MLKPSLCTWDWRQHDFYENLPCVYFREFAQQIIVTIIIIVVVVILIMHPSLLSSGLRHTADPQRMFECMVAPLGRSWSRLGALLGCLGGFLGRLGALLGRLGAVFGASWAVLERREAENAKTPKSLKNH